MRGPAACAVLFVLLSGAPTQAGYEYAFGDLDQVRLVEPASGDWSVTLGAGAANAPDYSGASSTSAMFLPVIESSWRNRLHISALQGIRYDLLPESTWDIGPLLRMMSGRPNEGALGELEEIDGGLGGGLYVAYRYGAVQFRVDATSAMTGDVSGSEIIASATWQGQLAPRWIASIGPSVLWMSDNRMEDLYGVSAAAASILGVSAYQPSSDLSAFRLSSNLTWIIDRNWSTSLIAVGVLLRGDAADSPIVDELGDELYGKLALTVNYRF